MPDLLCRDCFHLGEASPRCPVCGSPRVLVHEELTTLSIAHIDCDSFYASVEKRDNPELKNKAVIIGGEHRGVVSTACYIARIHGVRSAMPMFQAKKLCPHAVIIKPRMEVYAEVSRQIRAMMDELTPKIEPLSLDEAFLDLTGTERVHKACPAVSLAKFAQRIERELGLTISVGLSHNKFLAKIASDFDKPRGFSIIGKAETEAFLHDKPIRMIWGVGRATQKKLEEDGIHIISDLLRYEEAELLKRYGVMGARLYRVARGQDSRQINESAKAKSLSNETTFEQDIHDIAQLDRILWDLCEKLSKRAKAQKLAGRTLTLKLKTSKYKTITRSQSTQEQIQYAEHIYDIAKTLLPEVMAHAPFRLLGVGLTMLEIADGADFSYDLLNVQRSRREKAESARDKIREKFGSDAIFKGRSKKRDNL